MKIIKLFFPYKKHTELGTGVLAFIANTVFFVGVLMGLFAFWGLINSVGLLILGFEHSVSVIEILANRMMMFVPSFLFAALSALIWTVGRLVESLLFKG